MYPLTTGVSGDSSVRVFEDLDIQLGCQWQAAITFSVGSRWAIGASSVRACAWPGGNWPHVMELSARPDAREARCCEWCEIGAMEFTAMRVDNVSAAIQSNARRRPEHPALIQDKETVTCGDLEQRVQHAAGALRSQGVKQGEIVAVSMGDTIDQIIVIFALMRLGAVMLPMDVRWTESESLRVASFFSASTLLVDNADWVAEGID